MISGLERDEWLSTVMEQPVYYVTDAEECDPREVRAFIWAKTNSNDSLERLMQLGFHYIDTNIIFRKGPGAPRTSEPEYNYIDYVQETDKSDIVRIAETSFKSRFHLDPWISKETANKIKVEWVTGFFRGERNDNVSGPK